MAQKVYLRIRVQAFRWLNTALCVALLISSSPLILPPAYAKTVPQEPVSASRVAVLSVLSRSPASDEPRAVGQGTIFGRVVEATGGIGLPGVQVVASGVIETLPQPTFLPLVQGASASTAQSNMGPGPAVLHSAPMVLETAVFTTTTDVSGEYSLVVPAGDYALAYTGAAFAPDKRQLVLNANEVRRLDDVRLHALDLVATDVGIGGGTALNSLGNSRLTIPAGALVATEKVRVTYVANEDLPGFFADGSIPMGFSSFEPEGLAFPVGNEVLWTVEYTGDLPVGTDTLCYWWDGSEERWRDPVPGQVVDAGGGQKALEARVPHFSFYGHALPGVAGQEPGQGGRATITTSNNGQGGSQTDCPGCNINVGTGSVSESYAFRSVGSLGFPVALTIRYSTSNDTPTVTARVPFEITTQVPRRAEWRIELQGQVHRGEGYTAEATWDTRNAYGERVAPGMYPFEAEETFFYDSGARPTLAVDGSIEVRRGDISPFGFNWLSSYDTLLVDRSDTVTIIQGDGQYLTYTRQDDGTYSPPPEEYSALVRLYSGSWLRRSRQGQVEWFNADGRLMRLKDRNGNAHTLAYEPNGAIVPEGAWGVRTRLISITDTSGGITSFTYGADGYVSRVTDPIGRQYELSHDAAGNLTGIVDPLGRVTTYEYDGNHLLVAYTEPSGGRTQMAYDEERRLVSHMNALGGTRMATYGDGENVFTDERGFPTSYQFNAYGAITRVSNPEQSYDLLWDPQRQFAGTAPPYRGFEYDERGNLTEATFFSGVKIDYEPTTNLASRIVDGAGNTTQYDHDALGSLTSITDADGNASQMAYDEFGQISQSMDPLGNTVDLGYDSGGNLTLIGDAMGFETHLAYDDAGNLVQLKDAEDRVTQFAYDTMNRLTSLTDALGQIIRYEYDNDDNVTRLLDGNDHGSTFGYDALGRLTSEIDPLGQTRSFTYDGVGNLTAVAEANDKTVNLVYDGANRLIEEQYSDGSGARYSHDLTGDLTDLEDDQSRVAYSYISGIPGTPDTIATELLAPAIRTTVSYDYMIEGSTQIGAAGAGDGRSQPHLPLPALAVDRNGPSLPTSAPARSAMVPTIDQGGPAPVGEPLAQEPPAELQATPSDPVVAIPDPAAQVPYREISSEIATNVCGIIGANTVWNTASSPYSVTCDVTVAEGVTLTIEPGVVVKFAGWDYDLWTQGTLIAEGTATQPIVFTSVADDTVGGDTNLDGAATQPGPGDWSSVGFTASSSGSILTHVDVRYGGAQNGANVWVNSSDVSISNITVASSSDVGLWLENALPPALTSNTFLNNTGVAVWAPLSANDDSITLSGNTGQGNLSNGFVTRGDISGNVIWDGDDLFPFVAWEDLIVNEGAGLTLTPGTVMKFHDEWDDLWIRGTLTAAGSEEQPIIFTSITDDSVGGDTNDDGSATQPGPGGRSTIGFVATSSGSVLDYVVARYGSGQTPANMWVNSSDVSISNSTFAFSANVGLWLENALPATLTNNTFLNNTGVAVWAPLSANDDSITLSGNVAQGNQLNGFVTRGEISGDVIWDGDDLLPFVVWEDLIVNEGAGLTLTPGTVMKFNDEWDDLWVRGTLIAAGTEEQPITFTSVTDDTVGGDTNDDGSASLPGPGQRSAIGFIDSGSGGVLDHVVARYGGGQSLANVWVNTSDISISNSTIASSSDVGLWLENALPPALTNNTFVDNKGVAVWAPLSANDDSITLSGNTGQGNQLNGFVTNGGISGNVTWDGDDLFPFVISDDLTVNEGSGLTLTPGTVMKFHDEWDDLWVRGTLVANGSEDRPITFTSIKEDAVGGDTNGDGPDSSPAPDDWSSLAFASSSVGSTLDHVVVRYGGGQSYSNVWTSSGDMTVSNSTISHSGTSGITLEGASPSISGNVITKNAVGIYAWRGSQPIMRDNLIFGNSQYGIVNDDHSVTIDAENNRWRSPSGPYDPSDDRAAGGLYNPEGDGDSVSDRVDYEPWQVITGLRYGMTIATEGNPAETVEYTYDALNRLSSLASSGVANFTYNYAYDASGRMVNTGPTSGAAGVKTSLEYDANSRLVRLANISDDGAVTFNDLGYTYDSLGNVASATDGIGSTAYTYDALYRLTGANGPEVSETYTYDAVGNRLTKNTVAYTYDEANQLISSSDGTSYSYDGSGNLRSRTLGGQATTYSWDANNQLVRIDFSDGSSSEYSYDAFGRRVSKRDRSGSVTYFVYDGVDLVQELAETGSVQASYIYDSLDHPLAMARAGITYYYLYDRLGSVVGLADVAGSLVASYEYDPWGNVIDTGGSNPGLANPFRFAGREWDDESGLYYLRARYYDPQVGRFISRDPERFGRLDLRPKPNLYSYADNNPLNYHDPTGRLTTEAKLMHLALRSKMWAALFEQLLTMTDAVARRQFLAILESYVATAYARSLAASSVKAALVPAVKLVAALAAGYGAGWLINTYVLPCSTKKWIGDQLFCIFGRNRSACEEANKGRYRVRAAVVVA